MIKLYPIQEEEWPTNDRREVLYVVTSGKILAYSDTALSLASGDQAKVTAGVWATKKIMLAGFQLAELKNGNIKLGIGGNPVIIGPKTYTNVKPV